MTTREQGKTMTTDAFLALDQHRLHYRIDGDAGPWLTFCNSLGTDLHMWDAQVAVLSARFRVLRYDRRGHGLSTTPAGDCSLADLGADVLALLDALDIARTHYCGLSIGGLTTQWLALHAPQRLQRVAVCASAAMIGSPQAWHARAAQVRANGLAELVPATAERWFGDTFRQTQPQAVAAVLASFQATSAEGYAACCAALASADLRQAIARIELPLLAVSGDDDAVCPPADLQAIADAAHGRHLSLPGRHLVNVESADAFTAALAGFLA